MSFQISYGIICSISICAESLNKIISYLRDTLLVLSSEENGPGNATGVLALKEERLGFAILESEDLAVTTDVELAL
jgi:hypothetical protein